MRHRAFPGLSRFVLVIAVSSLGAACSADVARFDENPFTSRQVASAPPRQVEAAPVARVESQPLPARDFAVTAPPSGNSQGDAPFGQGVDAGLTTGTVTPRQPFGSANPPTPAVRQMAAAPTAPGRGAWSASGGTTITAAPGDTPDLLSRRYGVPAGAIAQANGIAGNQPFSAGQSVVIPTYSMVSASQPAAVTAPVRAPTDLVRQPAAAEQPRRVQTQAINLPPQRTEPAVAPASGTRLSWQSGSPPAAAVPAARPTVAQPVSTARPTATARPGNHTVTSGETLAGVARRYGVTRQQLAAANRIEVSQSLRTGQVLRLPAATQVAVAAQAAQTSSPAAPTVAPTPAARREQAQRAVAEAQATPAGRQADPRPTAAISPVQPQPAAQPVAPAPAPIVAEVPAASEAPPRAASAEPQFRWPVRGRVVSGFRAGTNDGIKLSVPQGTPIKAAEDGVVAYAGNELRGYGNLVLVRHANGFVTAYAHNSTIAVRRGEQVRRGQTIAAAGQTGNVSSPQLHFEIRRGATPVDPMAFLGAN